MRKKTKLNILVDAILYLMMIFIIVIMLCPLVNVAALSLSSPYEIIRGNVTVFPRGFDLVGYKLLFTSQNVPRAYLNTILYTALSTLLCILVSTITAYPLSVRSFSGKKYITFYITIPMLISGGLIPFFLVINWMGLYGSMWSFILPSAFATWYIFIVRANYLALPTEIRESAFIDGANDIKIWFSIYIPLSKPIIATIGLFAAVSMWNSFFYPYLFLDDSTKWPLQLILRKLLLEGSSSEIGASGENNILVKEGITELLKYVATIVTIGPIILLYPFVQRYFTKGILVGSVKG